MTTADTLATKFKDAVSIKECLYRQQIHIELYKPPFRRVVVIYDAYTPGSLYIVFHFEKKLPTGEELYYREISAEDFFIKELEYKNFEIYTWMLRMQELCYNLETLKGDELYAFNRGIRDYVNTYVLPDSLRTSDIPKVMNFLPRQFIMDLLRDIIVKIGEEDVYRENRSKFDLKYHGPMFQNLM